MFRPHPLTRIIRKLSTHFSDSAENGNKGNRQAEEEHWFQLKKAVETMPLGVLILDLEGNILYANPTEASMHGYQVEELRGKHVSLLTPPEYQEELSSERIPRLKNQRRESIHQKKDGNTFPVSLMTELVYESNGTPCAIVIHCEDISERKKSEQVQASLYHISEATHKSPNLEALFPAIHDIVAALMPARNFYIAVYDTETGILQFPYYADEHGETPTHRQLWKRIAEYIFRTEKPVSVSPQVFKMFAKPGELDQTDARFGAWLGVPLKTHQAIIGVLAVQNYAEGILYGEKDKRLLTFVSTQIATSIERVRAEEELIRHQDHLEELVKERTRELTQTNEQLRQEIAERKRAEQALQQHSRNMVLLNHLGELLNVCRSEEETYSKVMNICKLLFPEDSGSLCITNSSAEDLKIVGSWGDNPPDPRILSAENWLNFPPSHLLLENDHRQSDELNLEKMLNDSYLCIPISNLDEALGMFALRFRQYGIGELDPEYQRRKEVKRAIMNRVSQHYALALGNLRLRETLRMESIRDTLTGLYNRRHMEESLAREASRARRRGTPVGIIMLDVDHFKTFNDTHGHEAGDVVLRELGVLLQSGIRGEDIACRYGGEEFLLILPDSTIEATQRRAEEIRQRAQALRITYHQKMLNVTISLGVATLPEYGEDVATVVNAADSALYRAKEGGRNQVMATIRSEE